MLPERGQQNRLPEARLSADDVLRKREMREKTLSTLGQHAAFQAGGCRVAMASACAAQAMTAGHFCLSSIISRPPEVLKHPPLRTRAEDGLCLPAPSRRQTSFAQTDPLPLATAGFVVHVFMHIDFY